MTFAELLGVTGSTFPAAWVRGQEVRASASNLNFTLGGRQPQSPQNGFLHAFPSNITFSIPYFLFQQTWAQTVLFSALLSMLNLAL